MNPEAKIRQLEAEVRHLYAMLQGAPDFITRITVDGKLLFINHLAPGFRMEEVVGSSIENYIPAEFLEQAHAAIRAACETHKVQEYPTMGKISSDRVGHYLTRMSPIVEHGVVTSLVLTSTDVTALEEQRVLLQLALDSGNLGIWTFNPSLGSGTWDNTTRLIFGVAESDNPPPLPQMLDECIHADDRERVLSALNASHASGRFGPIEHRIKLRSGEVRWISASGLTIRDPHGVPLQLVGSMQDITARKVLEARLLEAEKLESIGRLAGGVAHDFNNMLTAILGNVDFASQSESITEIRQLLDDVRLTAERSAALTAQLLAFARRQVIEPKILDINLLVQRLHTVFRRAMGEPIRTELTIGATGCVRADESQLEQVIMNLVTNARDAMPTGGVLSVETSDVEFTSKDFDPSIAPGHYVVVRVTDTGRGIPAHALPRVFEPFYTTRALGTGLGLATCYGIVKQVGGHITVSSELDRGTTFKVYFPRVEGEAPSKPKPATITPEKTGERILLIEDEDPVRAVVERTLRRQGYHVVSAASAEHGLALLDHESDFDLLVTDVVLPGMGGRTFAEHLLQRMPRLKVLYVSGYTEDAVGRGGVLDPGLHFLQKPFIPSELAEAIRRLLSKTD